MDFIILTKALSIGCLGAGGFYFFMSFVFHYFPMPLLISTKDWIAAWTSKKYKAEGDVADKIWSISHVLLKTTLLLIWWATFGLYAYLLHRVLHHYLPLSGNEFWMYYGIAIFLPSLWVLIKFIGFLRKKEKKQPVAVVTDKPNGTLLEQMVG